MSQENNKVTIRRFYDEVINQKKLAVIEELYSASYVSHCILQGKSVPVFTRKVCQEIL